MKKRITNLSQLPRRKLGDPIKLGRTVEGIDHPPNKTSADRKAEKARLDFEANTELCALSPNARRLLEEASEAAGRAAGAKLRRHISILRAKVHRLEGYFPEMPSEKDDCKHCGSSRSHADALCRQIHCVGCGNVESYEERFDMPGPCPQTKHAALAKDRRRNDAKQPVNQEGQHIRHGLKVVRLLDGLRGTVVNRAGAWAIGDDRKRRFRTIRFDPPMAELCQEWVWDDGVWGDQANWLNGMAMYLDEYVARDKVCEARAKLVRLLPPKGSYR